MQDERKLDRLRFNELRKANVERCEQVFHQYDE